MFKLESRKNCVLVDRVELVSLKFGIQQGLVGFEDGHLCGDGSTNVLLLVRFWWDVDCQRLSHRSMLNLSVFAVT